MYIPRDDEGSTSIPCLYFSCGNKQHSPQLMIYFHGIGEDLGLLDAEVCCIGEMLNMNVLAVEYPGFGTNFY